MRLNYTRRPFLVGLLIALTTVTIGAQEKKVLAETPPMGWNSWNFFGKKNINEQVVYDVIDAMVSTGLRDAGYTYVVVDGGWRDDKLDASGRLLPHPDRFPNGIKPLADYAHSKGLKFGLHTVPGEADCGGDPVGGKGHEEIQIQQFVDWGIDFIKLDRCRFCVECKKGEGWTEESIEATYRKWSNLLRHSGRDILFSVSAYQFRDWNPELCNMSRTTGDIATATNGEKAVFIATKEDDPHFFTVMECAELNNKSARFAGNGYWNDPDMLVTGKAGLTKDEEISHFALWTIMSSPLFLGNDPRNMDPSELNLILNSEMIAVDQDHLEQGYKMKDDDGMQIWRKKMSDGSFTFLLLNVSEDEKMITLNFDEFNLGKKVKFRNLTEQKNEGRFKKRYTAKLAPHACRYLRTVE